MVVDPAPHPWDPISGLDVHTNQPFGGQEISAVPANPNRKGEVNRQKTEHPNLNAIEVADWPPVINGKRQLLEVPHESCHHELDRCEYIIYIGPCLH